MRRGRERSTRRSTANRPLDHRRLIGGLFATKGLHFSDDVREKRRAILDMVAAARAGNETLLLELLVWDDLLGAPLENVMHLLEREWPGGENE